jgi:hypothetical protein
MNDNNTYSFLGNFSLRSARKICAWLEEEHIEFELEIDDTPIRDLPPFQAGLGGTFGRGASANIYVHADALEQCASFLENMN